MMNLRKYQKVGFEAKPPREFPQTTKATTSSKTIDVKERSSYVAYKERYQNKLSAKKVDELERPNT